ncbi:MAG: amino acid adenylation domain-containing protein, partial [Myxococcales bacterium]|nr:amino acid adenylation domain-containing protein [Myxococcales bacterium]
MRSCVVLGEGGFGRRVVAISRGLLRVRGVLCADGGLARWADPLGVEIGSSREQLREWLDEGVDLLFDFSGRWGLGRQELARVRRAIAYHDGPDVGDHATTRAILAGARQHHVGLVELGVDGEPRAVLATRPVEIAEDETTGTLNAKCFEVGVAAFEALLPRLLDDTAAPLDVGVSCGALSPSASPLVAAPELGLGALDFSRAARDLDRTLRALDFGPSVNTLCLPKVALAEGEVLVVRGGGYVAADGRAVPGEIVGRDGASWTVATGEGALVLREPRTLDGRPTDLPPVGARLATSPLQIALGLSAALAPHERFFVTRLREGAGAPAPFGRGSRAGRARTLVLPELVDPLGAFALVLRRAMDSDEPALLGLHTPEHSTWDARLHLPYAPFALPTGARRDVALFFAAVADERAAVQARRGMMRDLPLRFGLDLPALPVRVQLGGPRPEGLPGEAELLLHLAEDGRASLLADEGRISSDALSRLGRMIEVVAAGPHDVEAAVAPILDARERARSLSLAGLSDPTSATPGAPPTLAALWRASVDAHPSGRALEDAEGALSYAELAERTAAFAARLSSEGVGPGDRVGVAMERGLLSTIASLAILDVGATFVALDPTLPLERLQHVVDAAGLRLLLTSRACEATARLLKAEERVVEASWCEPVAGPRAEVLATSEGGAYLIFTSGSTGVPKGVLVPHRAIATQATAVAARYGLGPSDRALQVASPCFDLAIEELFAPLAVGATVVLAPPNLLQSYEGFRRFVEERELTFLNLPTAFFGGFMEHLARLDAPLPAALRGLVVGTDVATRRHLELFLGRCASRRPRWFNAYGLTEAAVTSTVYEHEGDEPVHPVPIGRPLPGTYAYVVDSAGEPRPQGLVGELWIGGAGLAEGYLSDGGRGQAELTTARFTADPFARAGRVYRTGDFAYCDERGQLCFIGRNDDQVKVRGYRVELGEIEVALCRHPRVRRAVVRAWPGAGADKRLCAYVEPDVEPNGGALARDELVAHLAAW